jgi:MATE family multidrug resistance protein
MNIFSPGMYTTFFTVILHPLWCYIFIDVFDYDVAGAGIAMSITQLLNYIIISFYIYYVNPYPESNLPFTLDVFEGEYILKFLKKAIPAAVLFAADWLGFEILTLMSSYLSAVDLAANICLFNYITNIFMISMGLSFACSTLVGNSIGANNVNKAKKYTWAGLICGVCIIGTTTLFTLIFRESIPYVYTSEKEIADKVLELLGIYVCFSIIDAVQVVLNGVIKGLGKQKIASIICLTILYPINIPLAYILAFTYNLGLIGLWYSQLVSIILLAVANGLITLNCDWNKIAMDVDLNISKDEKILVRKNSRIV